MLKDDADSFLQGDIMQHRVDEATRRSVILKEIGRNQTVTGYNGNQD